MVPFAEVGPSRAIFEGYQLKGVRFVRKESCVHACMQSNRVLQQNSLHLFAIMNAHFRQTFFFVQIETSH